MALSASPVVDSLVGIGLRSAHVPALRALRPSLGFLEVHSENYFADGGAALAELMEMRALYPIALHGVGLSLGSALGVDEAHLARLARLVERVDPVRVSDHASFARAATASGAVIHAADLLPLPFRQESLSVLVANIQHVQERLARPILIENLSAYLSYDDDEMDEPAFLVEVCRRSGCQLLLDLNNLVVNGLNRARREGWQPGAPQIDDADALRQARAFALDFVWSLPAGCVGQFHLAGFRWPEQADRLVIDDHSQRISPTVWDVFEQALLHVGERPTLVEWDVDLPPLAVLLDEARLAAACLARAMGLEGLDDEDEGGG
ncbi:MAG: DUF692 domain-containing protein [Aquabacterium sp.]